MKHFLLMVLLPFFSLCKVSAQSVPDSVNIAARFGSICCGPDSELFLKDFLKKFNQGKCRKVIAYKAAGCGKEGEFFILFSLKKLRAARKDFFKMRLEELIDRENLKNKAENSSSGGIALQYNIQLSSLSYCRIPTVKW